MKIILRFFYIVLIILLAVFLANCTSSTDSKSKKQVVSFQDVWFSDAVDNDGDGYNSYARLNFDLDVSRGNLEVFVKIGVRFTDPLDTAGYYLYLESGSLVIDGTTTEDAVYIAVGYPNDELPEGGFDFLIQVCAQSDPEKVLVELSPANDDNLSNVLTDIPLEESFTDAGLAIYDAYWTGWTDNDGDSYASEATLVVDVDVNVGNTSDVFLVIYQKNYTSGSYSVLAVSEVFTVSGSSSEDAMGFVLTNFPHNLYDFKIEAYYDGGYYIEDTDDPVSNADLNDVALEPATEDVQTLNTWLWWDDGSYEEAYTWPSGGYFAVQFQKPVEAINCTITSIAINVTLRDLAYCYARFRVWDSFSNYPNNYIYAPAGDTYVGYDNWNYISPTIDVSSYSTFYVGFQQIYAYGFYLRADLTYPSQVRSYESSSGTSWSLLSDRDYAIQVYVEYTLSGKQKNSVETRGEWISSDNLYSDDRQTSPMSSVSLNK